MYRNNTATADIVLKREHVNFCNRDTVITDKADHLSWPCSALGKKLHRASNNLNYYFRYFATFSERRHEWFRSSLDHVLIDQLSDIYESDEDDLSTSPLSEDDNRKFWNHKPEADQASCDGLSSLESDISEPRKLAD